MNPLPSVDNLYPMIIREERDCFIVRDKDERLEAVAFTARAVEKNSSFCSYCAKSIHVASNFFKFIGYPDW